MLPTGTAQMVLNANFDADFWWYVGPGVAPTWGTVAILRRDVARSPRSSPAPDRSWLPTVEVEVPPAALAALSRRAPGDSLW